MLAKIWKKLLLAICILACVYNVMNKLISRTSLEMQLKSVQNQGSIIDMLKESEKTKQIKEKTSSTSENNSDNINKNESLENATNKIEKDSVVIIY